MSINKPGNCSMCNCDVTDRYCTDRIVDGKIVETLCRKCDNTRVLNDYITSHRLSTSFMMQNMLELYDLSKMLWNTYPYFDNLLDTEPYADILYNPIHFNMWMSLAADSTDTLLKVRLEAFAAVRNVDNKVKEFEQKVWYGGLQKQIRASTMKGVSAKIMLNDIEYSVLTYSMCARTMITFDLPDCSLTAITIEDESDRSYMGIQGIDATEAQAISLVDTALSLWETGTLIFQTDKKVGLAIPGFHG